MEDMPEAFINLGDEVLRATPENSRLITFLGREALNCILIGGEDYTMIMFDTSEHFDELGTFMVENEYPLHLNQQEVPDEIMDYYVSLEAEDIPDTIPDWMSQNSCPDLEETNSIKPIRQILRHMDQRLQTQYQTT